MTLFEPNAGQRWRLRVPTWRPVSEGGFDASRYEVREIPYLVARDFVVTHHYIGSYPADRLRYGLVDRVSGRLVGVAVFAVPTNRRSVTNVFGERAGAVAGTLARFVLLDEVPSNAETFFLSAVYRAAARDHQLRGVLSFSDPMPRPSRGGQVLAGHVGGIYQVQGQGRYAERGTRRTLTFLPDWSVLSDRTAQKIRSGAAGGAPAVARLVAMGATPPGGGEDMAAWLRFALAEVGALRAQHDGNHRYVFAIGSQTQRRWVLGEVRVPTSTDFPSAPDPAPVFTNCTVKEQFLDGGGSGTYRLQSGERSRP